MNRRGDIPHELLTARDRGEVIKVGSLKIGAVIRIGSGRYAAWSTAGKLGEFATPGEAANRVFRAAEKKGKAS